MGQNYDALSDKEKAAIDWKIEQNYQDQLDTPMAAIAKNAYASGQYQATMREQLADTSELPERVANIVKEHELALKAKFDIGSKFGRSVVD